MEDLKNGLRVRGRGDAAGHVERRRRDEKGPPVELLARLGQPL